MKSNSRRARNAVVALAGAAAMAASLVLAAAIAAQPAPAPAPTPLEELARRTTSTMSNPYRLVERWPTLPDGMTWGAAIGIIPDEKGGAWMMFRSEPPIHYIDASGKFTKSFGRGLLVQAHGFCMDHDGNLWAGDSGPFAEDPATKGRGFQLHKLTQDGQLLLSLGKAGVSQAGRDTFIGPTACAVAANGDILVADGHWPRPTSAQQDGDRIVRLKPDGTFVTAVGSLGSGPGQFMGPHALAFDSRGRLFVADRSNNRVQVLDENLHFVDEWRHFGRPSGVAILNDDTLIVADSESTNVIDGPPQAPEGGGRVLRNPGWQTGIRIGSAVDGSLREFVPGTRPEGLAGDELGNIFAGLTGRCDLSPSGGCLQKWVRMQR
jgi:sugar lactone lactonase YvrE